MTIVETRAVTGGVDTHADVHVAAALDSIGGLLGVQEFPATPGGYAGLLEWLGGFGAVCLVGIEGTGSYGAGLARHIAGAGVRVVEVDRSDRQDRRRRGKSDPLDAISAARAAPSGRAPGAPRGRDGTGAAIRVVVVAQPTAPSAPTQTINHARSLVPAAPTAASSGRTVRHRLNPGGDRQANQALWGIVIARMGSPPPTRAYVDRRSKEGLSKTEIIRCLKRYVAREVSPHLRPPAS